MPTRSMTAMELRDAKVLFDFAAALGDDSDADSNDEDLADILLYQGAEMLGRRLIQDIGRERLSMGRLQREAAAARCDESDLHWNTYSRFGFRLDHLPMVIEALQVPDGFRTLGSHVFSGEEGVLSLAATPLS